MEELKRQKSQDKNVNRILRTETSRTNLKKNFKEHKKRKQKEMMKKKRPLMRYN